MRDHEVLQKRKLEEAHEVLRKELVRVNAQCLKYAEQVEAAIVSAEGFEKSYDAEVGLRLSQMRIFDAANARADKRVYALTRALAHASSVIKTFIVNPPKKARP